MTRRLEAPSFSFDFYYPMESSESRTPEIGDYSASVPLEISSQVAGKADDLLRAFAEDAGLETALIVDRSGALVAGISAEAEVTIEVISALVAGASGAMRALVAQLGETGAVESLHLGGDRMIYLREIVNRFILVGVSDASRPAGLVRQKAQSIEAGLSDLLREVKPCRTSGVQPASVTTVRPLREVARRGVVERLDSVTGTEEAAGVGDETGPVPEVPDVPFVAMPKMEPREFLEPLDSGEPEIVIEKTRHSSSSHLPVMRIPADSPFETEELGSVDGVDDDLEGSVAGLLPSELIFELEGFDREDDDERSSTIYDDPIKKVLDTDIPRDSPGASFDEAPPRDPDTVFEIDEFEEESGKVADDETDDLGSEIKEMLDAEDEESEVRSSGPFYF